MRFDAGNVAFASPVSQRAGLGNGSSELGALSRNAEPEQLGERWVCSRELAGGGGPIARVGLAYPRLYELGPRESSG